MFPGTDPENDALGHIIVSGNDKGYFALSTVGQSNGDASDSGDDVDSSKSYTVISKVIETGIVVASPTGFNYEDNSNTYHLTILTTDRTCPCLTDTANRCYREEDQTCQPLSDDETCSSDSVYLCGGLHHLSTVTVNIIDSNDIPTMEDNQIRFVKENDRTGITIGNPLRADDEDVDATLIFMMFACEATDPKPNPGDDGDANIEVLCPFRLDSTTGQLSVDLSGGAVLDYETVKQWSLGCSVEDQWGATSPVRQIYINVEDVNERPTVQPQIKQRIIEENSDIGEMVENGMIIGEDQDAGTTLRYRLVGTNTLFSINSVSGNVFLKKNQLNYEEKSSYYLMVEAVDDGQPSLTSITTTIQITVVDVNENPILPSNVGFAFYSY